MSHGGGESGRVHEKSQHAKRKTGASGDEFSQAIAKIAVAQICEGAGFQSFQQSALEILSDVTVQYISNLGKLSQSYANLAGRTDVNAFDIIQGLEEFGSLQGYGGASDIDHCIASSGTVRELVQYVTEAEHIPFAYSIPPFPVVRERRPCPSFVQIGEEPPGDHIPAWLPAFPDPQTYVKSSTENEGAADCNTRKIELAQVQTETDRSLLNLQNFICNGSGGPSSFAHGGGSEAKLAVEGNPFLAAPLQFGEKEVSHVVPPAKFSNEAAVKNPTNQNFPLDNHVSVLDTFAPAIEAMKSSLCDSEEGQKKVLLNPRPAVQFKIGAGKKTLGTALDFSSHNKGVEKISPWSGKYDEKDDKKKRAEKILKQSMQNPGELAQL
ncbi:transcription initiation factor TFIID subunit 8 [Manihot esculenta]|uniref:Uncharacterized protein n=2 Tax=Manihot esculenta TaxID=3983 RepID=A0ACB7IDT7_MANES|nr:transcription initiation factor TFIID subunit 8 [Manihot esculenta]KAG8662360.1 hypothetical protein MANES_01G094300v8 [Manihot esculenta]OAY60204.1 hypothetical protein MANES_01G094300v8 [Manihot esculenta]